MRKLNSKHWVGIKKLEGLLFFAQLVDEMLFDYTLDSYKPLALNSRLLCIESLDTIKEIKDGYIPKKNLQSVLEELKWSLSNDIAAKDILGIKFNQYLDKINPNAFKLNEIENVIRLLYNSFNSRKYLDKIKSCLIDLIVIGKDKSKIKSLTGSFLTELINYGYDASHIYYQNYNFFFNTAKRKKILNSNELEVFFKIFNFEENEFTVVFIGGIIFRNFTNTLNSFNIVVTKTYNCFSAMQSDSDFKSSRKTNESFIICSKVNGLDHHSARENAEKLIGQISGIFNFYHHKEKPKINDKCIVQRATDNYVVVIDKPIRSVLKTKSEESPSIAAKSVEDTLAKFDLSRGSMYRFARSIDLHSAALTSNALENQLLDLWAALETLLPKDSESNKDRIVQICDGLIPFLQLNYILKIISELLKDLKIWDEQKTNKILSKIPNASNYSETEKIGALVSLETNKNLRLEFYAEMEDFPLLKNRIYTLHKNLSSPEQVEKTLKRHLIKINWHLRRIYRTRGLVVHSGKYPSYTSILIENLHNFLDLFLTRIIELSKTGAIYSIEQGVLETQVALQYQLELLDKHKGEELTDENFREALLGENNCA